MHRTHPAIYLSSSFLLRHELPAGPGCLRQFVEHRHGVRPADTRIRHAHTISHLLEDRWRAAGDAPVWLGCGRVCRRDLLTTFKQVAFDHDADDVVLAVAELTRNVLGHDGLSAEVFAGVAVRAIDDQPGVDLGLVELLDRRPDRRRVVVGAVGAATEDDVAVGVAHRMHYRRQTLLRDPQEAVRVACRPHGINRNLYVTTRTVFESDGH
mmetsp:Transcript_40811/g.102017  ORF Transcript_40811/g.102017 Transcript_40811/m.102017 type:complete len:210 (-) Transcript_40811:760-1389(-)